MPGHGDDPLRAEALRCEHTAQPDGAVPDHHHCAARADLRAHCCMVPGGHHIREGEQTRRQFLVRVGHAVDPAEGAVGLGRPNGLALGSLNVVAKLVVVTPGGEVVTRHCHTVEALGARAATVNEGGNHKVTDGQVQHIGANFVDDAHELMTDRAGAPVLADATVRPEVRAADTGRGDLHDGVGRPLNGGVVPVLHRDIAGTVDDCGTHAYSSNWGAGFHSA